MGDGHRRPPRRLATPPASTTPPNAGRQEETDRWCNFSCGCAILHEQELRPLSNALRQRAYEAYAAGHRAATDYAITQTRQRAYEAMRAEREAWLWRRIRARITPEGES